MEGNILPYNSRYIPSQEIADRLGMERSALFKYAKAQGVSWSKMRTEASLGQLTCCLSPEEAKQLTELRKAQGYKV